VRSHLPEQSLVETLGQSLVCFLDHCCEQSFQALFLQCVLTPSDDYTEARVSNSKSVVLSRRFGHIGGDGCKMEQSGDCEALKVAAADLGMKT
jgi:hypothetical protein